MLVSIAYAYVLANLSIIWVIQGKFSVSGSTIFQIDQVTEGLYFKVYYKITHPYRLGDYSLHNLLY